MTTLLKKSLPSFGKCCWNHLDAVSTYKGHGHHQDEYPALHAIRMCRAMSFRPSSPRRGIDVLQSSAVYLGWPFSSQLLSIWEWFRIFSRGGNNLSDSFLIKTFTSPLSQACLNISKPNKLKLGHYSKNEP